jgi:hypothetical protein
MKTIEEYILFEKDKIPQNVLHSRYFMKAGRLLGKGKDNITEGIKTVSSDIGNRRKESISLKYTSVRKHRPYITTIFTDVVSRDICTVTSRCLINRNYPSAFS